MENTKTASSRFLTGVGVAWAAVALLLTIGSLSDRMYLAAWLLIVSGLTALPWVSRPVRAAGVPRGLSAALPYIFGIAGVVAIGLNAPNAASSAKVSTTSMPAAKVPVIASSPLPDDQAAKRKLEVETAALWDSIISISEPCESASRQVAIAGKTGDMYQVYPAAKSAQTVCQDASSKTRGLSAPETAVGDVEDAFETGITKCADGHFAKYMAYEKLAAVADGDARPSAVTEAKEYLQTANAAGLYCAAGMMEAASKAGIDTKIFQKVTS